MTGLPHANSSLVFCSSLSWLVKSLSAMLTLEAAKITAVRRSAAASRRSAGVAGIGLRHDAIRNCPISNDFLLQQLEAGALGLGRAQALLDLPHRRVGRCRQVAHPRHIAAARACGRRPAAAPARQTSASAPRSASRRTSRAARGSAAPRRARPKAHSAWRGAARTGARSASSRQVDLIEDDRVAHRGLELIERAALRVGEFDRAGDLGDRPVGRGQVDAAAGRRRASALSGSSARACCGSARVLAATDALGANAVLSTSPMPWTPQPFAVFLRPQREADDVLVGASARPAGRPRQTDVRRRRARSARWRALAVRPGASARRCAGAERAGHRRGRRRASGGACAAVRRGPVSRSGGGRRRGSCRRRQLTAVPRRRRGCRDGRVSGTDATRGGDARAPAGYAGRRP